MFTRKIFVGLALLCWVGGAFSVAQVRQSQAKVAPMLKSDRKLKKCEVHHTALKVENVRITYGLMPFESGYFDARERYFPHASSSVMGGCLPSPDLSREQTVKFCPQCRVAEKRWSQTHRRSASKR